tara:strand:+ start:2613 stop:3686 length:1074 start_codon:yes stop_codon:yes gene_type:complete
MVSKVSGLFDIPPSEKLRVEYDVEVPDEDEDWGIGLIVGPSGSGKSTIASEVFGISEFGGWTDSPVIEDMGEHSVEEITAAMISVGFSSPPSWLKPFAVLSNGERFRCEMAKLILNDDNLMVVDEFTSVVDRQVAQTASIAIAKAIRKRNRRLVAVTCHYDVADYLEADWVLDMATGDLSRGRVQRSAIDFKVFRCEVAAWRMFEHHHYLNRSIHRSAQCYMATVNDKPAGICAMLPLMGRKGCWRGHRLVVLPDYQGIGLGSWLCEQVFDMHLQEGKRVFVNFSHPSLVRHSNNSSKWIATKINKQGQKNRVSSKKDGWKLVSSSIGRSTISYEYVGDGNTCKNNQITATETPQIT